MSTLSAACFCRGNKCKRTLALMTWLSPWLFSGWHQSIRQIDSFSPSGLSSLSVSWTGHHFSHRSFTCMFLQVYTRELPHGLSCCSQGVPHWSITSWILFPCVFFVLSRKLIENQLLYLSKETQGCIQGCGPGRRKDAREVLSLCYHQEREHSLANFLNRRVYLKMCDWFSQQNQHFSKAGLDTSLVLASLSPEPSCYHPPPLLSRATGIVRT